MAASATSLDQFLNARPQTSAPQTLKPSTSNPLTYIHTPTLHPSTLKPERQLPLGIKTKIVPNCSSRLRAMIALLSSCLTCLCCEPKAPRFLSPTANRSSIRSSHQCVPSMYSTYGPPSLPRSAVRIDHLL